jgi:hypothetical protein
VTRDGVLGLRDLVPGKLPPVRRPNGKLYRPRKIIAYPVADADELTSGVCVLGTHDIERARKLADKCVHSWIESEWVAAGPEVGWFREGYESGRPMWTRDEIRGRAGVMFHEAVEASHDQP